MTKNICPILTVLVVLTVPFLAGCADRETGVAREKDQSHGLDSKRGGRDDRETGVATDNDQSHDSDSKRDRGDD